MKEKGAGFKPWYHHRESGRSSKEIFESAIDKRFMDSIGGFMDTAISDWVKYIDSQKPLKEGQIDQLLDKISAKISFDSHKSSYEAILSYFLATIEKFLNRTLTIGEESMLRNKLKTKFFE